MDDKPVCEDIKVARSDETPSSIALGGQILIVAVAIGIAMKSWQWVVGSLLVLFIALKIPPIAIILVLLLSLGWALIGYEAGRFFFDPPSARFILGGVSCFVSLGINSCSLWWDADTGHE